MNTIKSNTYPSSIKRKEGTAIFQSIQIQTGDCYSQKLIVKKCSYQTEANNCMVYAALSVASDI